MYTVFVKIVLAPGASGLPRFCALCLSEIDSLPACEAVGSSWRDTNRPYQPKYPLQRRRNVPNPCEF